MPKTDPLEDLCRCAELLEQTNVLQQSGAQVDDVLDGIVHRIRLNVRRLRAAPPAPPAPPAETKESDG